jgi:hypothetical protein
MTSRLNDGLFKRPRIIDSDDDQIPIKKGINVFYLYFNISY